MGTQQNMNFSKLEHSVFENLSTALLIVDSAGGIVTVNPATEDLLSTSARRLEKQSVYEVFAGSPDFLAALDDAFGNNFTYTKRELEIQIPSSLDSAMIDCAFVPIRDEKILLIEMHDVGRQTRLARETNMLNQQNVLKTLVRGFAHEVKNPLGGIRGAAQLLESELASEELREYTEVIIGEATRLQKLVDQMLGPNRPSQKSRLNIHSVLERVRQLVLAESGDELIIQRDYDPSLPEILADQDQLIQAVLNITRNAKQALEGKGKIILRSRSKRFTVINGKLHRLAIALDIIDNGPGISADLLDQIFYPMVTGRAEGTGLGLSIAQNLVNQHGGTIECKSTPKETRFRILLPVQLEEGKE